MHKFTGRITKDATNHDFESGKSVINVTIVENHSYVDREDVLVEKPYFIECEFWNRKNLLPYLKKGLLIEVEGELGVRAYIKNKGKSDEKAVGIQTINVRNHRFLSSGKRAPAPETETPGPVTPEAVETGTDLPF